MKTTSFSILLALFVLLCATSCKKKDNALGKDILDNDAYLYGTTTDTFDILSYTIEEDSIITDNAANVVLGSYNDPVFGKFDASFYTQIRLAGINPNFGDPSTISIDSFVLALKYVGYYGDLQPQTFEVYELNEDLHIDSTYYAFTTKTTKPTNLVPLGLGTITPDPINKTIVGGDSLNPQLRIPLDTNLARSLILEATSGSATFSSNEAFLSYFKGIKIKTNNGSQSPGNGGAFYFNLSDPASKMTIYFHQGGIQKTFDLLINSSCADFIHIDKDYTGTPIEQILQDSTLGNNAFYAQAFNLRAVVKIPGLSALKNDKIIHRAELHLPIQFQNFYRYKPGVNVSVATRIKETESTYTSLGVLGVLDDFNKEFKIDIKQYVQAILNQDIENTGLILSPRFFINSSERIVFNGKNTNNKFAPRLVVTYTTY
jgi:hypothetical protein